MCSDGDGCGDRWGGRGTEDEAPGRAREGLARGACRVLLLVLNSCYIFLCKIAINRCMDVKVKNFDWSEIPVLNLAGI